MHRVRHRVKWLALLVWLTAWLPTATAEAAFHLEYVNEDEPVKNFSVQPLVPVTRIEQAVDRGLEVTRQRELARQRAAAARAASAIPASIVECESGGSYTAQNPTSTASGKYQFIDSTWDTMDGVKDGQYMGYAKARHAPPHIQDAAAAKLWDGGRGRGHWDC